MKRKLTVLALLLTILMGFGTSQRAEARPEVTLDVFYDALSPYGEWTEHEYYGYIWQPVGVDEYWKPYRDGNWQYSDEGWIWVSEEPWGWATYHYGRWVPDDYYGWIWIPGVDWAPAYVEWYESPGYIGWSPRPPDRNFFLEIGISFGGYGYYQPKYYGGFNYYKPYYYGGHKHHKKHHRKKHHYYDKHHYHKHGKHSVYVPYEHFSRKNAKLVAIDGSHNTVVYRNTKNINNVTVINNRNVYKGPDRYSVERRSGKKIKRVNVVDRDLVQVRGKRQINQLRDNQYNIYRPKVVKRGYEKPKTISKRYNRFESYKANNSKRLEKKGINVQKKDSVVYRNGSNTTNEYSTRYGYNNGASKSFKDKSRENKSKSSLATSKGNKKQTNRDKISTQYQSSNHRQLDKSWENKSRVNRSSSQNQYKSKQEGNKLRGKSGKNLKRSDSVNIRGNQNKVKSKPYKASNKSLSPPGSQKSRAAYKSQKPQLKSNSVNKAHRQQKSFKSNKANNHAKSRNVNKGNTYKKASKKTSSRNTTSRSMIKSYSNNNYKSTQGNTRNSANKSFNRQARR